MDPLEGLSNDSIRALVGRLNADERRTLEFPLSDIEFRASESGDGSRVLTGYAAVFGQTTTLYSGVYYQLDELVDVSAFDGVLASNPDVHLNVGHDMNRSIARTGIRGVGGLELSCDPHGLRVFARLNGADPDVVALAAKMDLGIMDQMSFAFRVGAYSTTTQTDENGRETETVTIESISDLYDVCVCSLGAYSTTEAALRSLAGSGAAVPNPPVTRTSEGAQDDPAVPEQADGAAVPNPSVARGSLIAEGYKALCTFSPRR